MTTKPFDFDPSPTEVELLVTDIHAREQFTKIAKNNASDVTETLSELAAISDWPRATLDTLTVLERMTLKSALRLPSMTQKDQVPTHTKSDDDRTKEVHHQIGERAIEIQQLVEEEQLAKAALDEACREFYIAPDPIESNTVEWSALMIAAEARQEAKRELRNARSRQKASIKR